MRAPVIITGGSSGIGQAIARRLRSAGHIVLNLDIVPSLSHPHEHVSCDLNDPDLIAAAIDQIPKKIKGLICVAGVGELAETPEKVVRINFLGTRYLTESIMHNIHPGGAITLVASSAGRDWINNRQMVENLLKTNDFSTGNDWLEKNKDAWQEDAYKFSKQCLAAYTYHAAGQAKNLNLRVNCINPGITETRLSGNFRDLIGHENYDRITRLMGRAGKPEDVAGLAEFLTVGDAAWINGVEITVDGGYHAGMVAGWHEE